MPQVTVLSGSLCNFTAMANQLSAQELVQWVGYTFSVVDQAADFYAIHRVRVLGDTYLAIGGLPNGIATEYSQDNHSFRMLQFAAATAQVLVVYCRWCLLV